MSSVTIRRIDDALKHRLRVQAAQHNRSMEEEARDILRSALCTASSDERSFVHAIREKMTPFGGVELDIPARESIRTPPDFSE